jgi:cold shock CspA family protein
MGKIRPAGTISREVMRVRWFDRNAGIGMIARAGPVDEVFFHFTTLPGQGYRTIRPGTPVQFEVVETGTGPTARNIQPIKEPSR